MVRHGYQLGGGISADHYTRPEFFPLSQIEDWRSWMSRMDIGFQKHRKQRRNLVDQKSVMRKCCVPRTIHVPGGDWRPILLHRHLDSQVIRTKVAPPLVSKCICDG